MLKKIKLIKSISFVLLISLFAEQVSYAAPELKPIQFDKPEKPAIHFKLPQSVALIEDGYKAPGSDKLIYLLQDAHTNPSGQINLSKTLDILLNEEKDLKTIFVEAGTGNDSLDFLKNGTTLEQREEVAMRYLKKGILHGEEYLNLTSHREMVLWGVEDMALYQRGIEAYRQTAKEREKFQDYLKKIGSAVETLKPRILSGALISFDAQQSRYLKGELSLTDYFEVLSDTAQQRNLSLLGYPYLLSLNALKEKEAAIDFKKANEEQEKALQSLSQEDRAELLELAEKEKAPLKLSSSEDRGEKAFYALLEEKVASVSSYPELAKYFAYLKEAKKIDPRKMLVEQKQLEFEIESSLAETADEKRLLRCQEMLRLYQKLFDLTMTPEEFTEYEDSAKTMDIRHLTGFLNRKIAELETYYERVSFLEEGFEDIVKDAETFYQLTKDRDEAFVNNMLEKLSEDRRAATAEASAARSGESREHRGESRRQDPPVRAVLITGGYHTPNLKALLKEKNISYVCIAPQVLQETNQKRYEQILLNQKISESPLAFATASMRSMSRTVSMAMNAVELPLLRTDLQELPAGTRLASTEAKPKSHLLKKFSLQSAYAKWEAEVQRLLRMSERSEAVLSRIAALRARQDKVRAPLKMPRVTTYSDKPLAMPDDSTRGARLAMNHSNPQLEGQLREFVRAMRTHLKTMHVKILDAFLFGSRANGRENGGSDVDVGILVDRRITKRDFEALRALWAGMLPLDLIIYSMDEIVDAIRQRHPGRPIPKGLLRRIKKVVGSQSGDAIPIAGARLAATNLAQTNEAIERYIHQQEAERTGHIIVQSPSLSIGSLWDAVMNGAGLNQSVNFANDPWSKDIGLFLVPEKTAQEYVSVLQDFLTRLTWSNTLLFSVEELRGDLIIHVLRAEPEERQWQGRSGARLSSDDGDIYYREIRSKVFRAFNVRVASAEGRPFEKDERIRVKATILQNEDGVGAVVRVEDVQDPLKPNRRPAYEIEYLVKNGELYVALKIKGEIGQQHYLRQRYADVLALIRKSVPSGVTLHFSDETGWASPQPVPTPEKKDRGISRNVDHRSLPNAILQTWKEAANFGDRNRLLDRVRIILKTTGTEKQIGSMGGRNIQRDGSIAYPDHFTGYIVQQLQRAVFPGQLSNFLYDVEVKLDYVLITMYPKSAAILAGARLAELSRREFLGLFGSIPFTIANVLKKVVTDSQNSGHLDEFVYAQKYMIGKIAKNLRIEVKGETARVADSFNPPASEVGLDYFVQLRSGDLTFEDTNDGLSVTIWRNSLSIEYRQHLFKIIHVVQVALGLAQEKDDKKKLEALINKLERFAKREVSHVFIAEDSTPEENRGARLAAKRKTPATPKTFDPLEKVLRDFMIEVESIRGQVRADLAELETIQSAEDRSRILNDLIAQCDRFTQAFSTKVSLKQPVRDEKGSLAVLTAILLNPISAIKYFIQSPKVLPTTAGDLQKHAQIMLSRDPKSAQEQLNKDLEIKFGALFQDVDRLKTILEKNEIGHLREYRVGTPGGYHFRDPNAPVGARLSLSESLKDTFAEDSVDTEKLNDLVDKWDTMVESFGFSSQKANIVFEERRARIGRFQTGLMLHGEMKKGVYVPENSPRLIRDNSPQVNKRIGAVYSKAPVLLPALLNKVTEESTDFIEGLQQNISEDQLLIYLANLKEALIGIQEIKEKGKVELSAADEPDILLTGAPVVLVLENDSVEADAMKDSLEYRMTGTKIGVQVFIVRSSLAAKKILRLANERSLLRLVVTPQDVRAKYDAEPNAENAVTFIRQARRLGVPVVMHTLEDVTSAYPEHEPLRPSLILPTENLVHQKFSGLMGAIQFYAYGLPHTRTLGIGPGVKGLLRRAYSDNASRINAVERAITNFISHNYEPKNKVFREIDALDDDAKIELMRTIIQDPVQLPGAFANGRTLEQLLLLEDVTDISSTHHILGRYMNGFADGIFYFMKQVLEGKQASMDLESRQWRAVYLLLWCAEIYHERGQDSPDGQRPPANSGARLSLAPHEEEVLEKIYEAATAYWAKLSEAKKRDAALFATAEWLEKIQLETDIVKYYPWSLDEVVPKVKNILGSKRLDLEVWSRIKKSFLERIKGRYTKDILVTYFHSVMRRIFGEAGLPISYFDDGLSGVVYQIFMPDQHNKEGLKNLMKRVFEGHHFDPAVYENIDRDAELCVRIIQNHIALASIQTVNIDYEAYHRNKGAYLMGYIRSKSGVNYPIVIAMLNEPGRGVYVDNVLISENEVNNIFSSTRASFQVSEDFYRERLDFLQRVVPWRHPFEVAASVGFVNPAKVMFDRAILEHIERTGEKFIPTPGIPGNVMVTFTLNSLDEVFKVISYRPELRQPESISKERVAYNYRRVHEMGRGGVFLDANVFSYVKYPRHYFSEEALQLLLERAPDSVIIDGDFVIITKLYVQRKVTPMIVRLNDTSVSYEDRLATALAIADCIEIIAMTGWWLHDGIKPKNLGWSLHGKVVSFDYDQLFEIANMTLDDHFMELLKSMMSEGIPSDIWQEVLKRRAHLFTLEFWTELQAKLRRGEVQDIFPYPKEMRFSNRFADYGDLSRKTGARLSGDTERIVRLPAEHMAVLRPKNIEKFSISIPDPRLPGFQWRINRAPNGSMVILFGDGTNWYVGKEIVRRRPEVLYNLAYLLSMTGQILLLNRLATQLTISLVDTDLLLTGSSGNQGARLSSNNRINGVYSYENLPKAVRAAVARAYEHSRSLNNLSPNNNIKIQINSSSPVYALPNEIGPDSLSAMILQLLAVADKKEGDYRFKVSNNVISIETPQAWLKEITVVPGQLGESLKDALAYAKSLPALSLPIGWINNLDHELKFDGLVLKAPSNQDVAEGSQKVMADISRLNARTDPKWKERSYRLTIDYFHVIQILELPTLSQEPATRPANGKNPWLAAFLEGMRQRLFGARLAGGVLRAEPGPGREKSRVVVSYTIRYDTAKLFDEILREIVLFENQERLVLNGKDRSTVKTTPQVTPDWVTTVLLNGEPFNRRTALKEGVITVLWTSPTIVRPSVAISSKGARLSASWKYTPTEDNGAPIKSAVVGESAPKIPSIPTSTSTHQGATIRAVVTPDDAKLLEGLSGGSKDTNGARLSRTDQSLLEHAADVVLGIKAALAVERVDGNVQIYSLQKNRDVLLILWIDEVGGAQQQILDTRVGKLRTPTLDESAQIEKGTPFYEEHLTQLINANRIEAPVTSSPAVPVKLVLHLDSLETFDKATLSNLLFHWSVRLSQGSVVVLSGSETRLRQAMDLVRQFSFKNFYEESLLPADFKDLSEAHLVQGPIDPVLKQRYPNAKWMALERNQGRTTSVFSFAPIEGLLELIARGNIRGAFELFKTLAPQYKDVISLEDFNKLIAGDEAMVAKYPLTALLKVDLQEALRLYQLSRTANIFA